MLNIDNATQKATSDDNLIPLINVVFLMLIFFMVAGQISRSDAIKIEPPFSNNDNRGAESDPVTLLVSADGAIYLQDEAIAREQLVERLNLLFNAAADPEQFRVLLKVDATLPVEELQAVLRQVRAAGLLKIALATRLDGGVAAGADTALAMAAEVHR